MVTLGVFRIFFVFKNSLYSFFYYISLKKKTHQKIMKLFAGRNLNIKKILVLLGYSFYREFMEGDFFFLLIWWERQIGFGFDFLNYVDFFFNDFEVFWDYKWFIVYNNTKTTNNFLFQHKIKSTVKSILYYSKKKKKT